MRVATSRRALPQRCHKELFGNRRLWVKSRTRKSAPVATNLSKPSLSKTYLRKQANNGKNDECSAMLCIYCDVCKENKFQIRHSIRP
jgi:hypothetical protein